MQQHILVILLHLLSSLGRLLTGEIDGAQQCRDGSMRLFDVKGLETRILRVQCPSTKSLY